MAASPVSVVIPTFNRSGLLASALESVHRCLAPGDEIVVVDDGSTDDTHDVVHARDAPWRGVLRYFATANGGVARARNLGVREARHDLVAFIDSDDVWLPGSLALRRHVMESEPRALFCFSDFGRIRGDGTVEPDGQVASWAGGAVDWDACLGRGRPYGGPRPAGIAGFRVHAGSLYHRLMRSPLVGLNTLLVRRTAASRPITFAEDLTIFEDWEYSARLAGAGDCAYLAIPTALQRSHGGPRLSRVPDVDSHMARLRVLDRVWGADAAFMQQHGDEARRALQRERRRVVRELIKGGRPDEAREWMRGLDRAGAERCALALPRPMLRWLLRSPPGENEPPGAIP